MDPWDDFIFTYQLPIVPGSKLLVLGMVIQPLIGNPYNGYINPYYWVDDHPLLYGNNGSLDPSTINHEQSNIHTVNIPLSHGSYRSKHHFSIYNPPVFKTNGWNPPKNLVFLFS